MPTLAELTLEVFGEDPFAALAVEITPSTHPHPTAKLRHWVLSRLRIAAQDPARIVGSRATPTALSSVPIVLVYTLTEDAAEEVAVGPDELQSDLELAVHTVIAEADLGELAIDDVLDAFDHVIKVVLLNDRQGGVFGEQAHTCSLGARRIQFEVNGDRLLIHSQRTFDIRYSEELGVPVESVLEQVHVDYDIPPVTGDPLETADDVFLTS